LREDIVELRLSGWWVMPKESSSSVRVFYPRWTRKELIEKLREKIGDLSQEFPLSKAVLFGSYARGNFTAASDVDLLLIYPGEARDDAYLMVRRILDLPRLELHLFSEDECKTLHQTVGRMIEKGVVIYPL